jgi:exodeoxyribonuclease V alpha subunit
MTDASPDFAYPQDLRTLDMEFAAWAVRNFVVAGAPAAGPAERLAGAVSFSLHLKHSCLDLHACRSLQEPALNGLLHGLDEQTVQSMPRSFCAAESDPVKAAPLVRSDDGRRIWLQKYFLFEQAVAARVRQLSGNASELPAGQETLLAQIYPPDRFGEDHDQLKAVRTALSHRFAVITGGPGTGKTWTVGRILALVLHDRPELRIQLAAPTGKAANRMMESLHEAHAAMLDTPGLEKAVKQLELPGKASTLHSLLGLRRASPRPRYHRHNPLPLDVLIIDEASMMDLPMTARVLDALPDDAREILFGDKDHLESVEAGGVLSELCLAGMRSIYRADEVPVAILSSNYRSEKNIQGLADAVNAGKAPTPEQLNNSQVRCEVTRPVRGKAVPAWVSEAEAGLQPVIGEIRDGRPVGGVLKRQARFQVLCALRSGVSGVAGINRRFEESFGKKYAGQSGKGYRRDIQAWYPGLPVMITRNDHERKLFNGDVGMVLPVVQEQGDWLIDTANGEPRACFLSGSAGSNGATPVVRTISFAQMPPFESCYALTVHKSQGSEYEKVLLILPDSREFVQKIPVITRELLYTGITRARKHVLIYSGKGVIEETIRQRTVRMSGLSHHPA